MKRNLYGEDHEFFRQVVTEFIRRNVSPHREEWDEARLISRDVWESAGAHGLVGLSIPEEYGGAGQARDYRFRNIVYEELARAGAGSLSASWGLNDDVVAPYLVDLGTETQKSAWLPGMADGTVIGAIAMTEPDTGSDLRGIKTSAVRGGGGWVLNGAKTFISSGILADVVIVVARTGEGNGSRDFTLFLVDGGQAGFSRGRKLRKVGLPGQDTAELFFSDVFVPDANVLGEVGGGFAALMEHLPMERLSIAANALATMQAAFEWTREYVAGRAAFGQPLGFFQNTRFKLADVAAELAATEALVDRAVLGWNAGDLTAVEAARAKLWASEALGRVVDICVQLHGGYGYMEEYPIARAFVDARVQRIYGGTSEIMRELIGRELLAAT